MTSYDDSNWQNLPEHYQLKLDNVGSTTITELMPGEYVGNDDAVDYRQITVAESGLYSFHFYRLTNPAELTVYVEENGRLRELEDEDGKRGENIILDPVRLDAGKVYYIAVRPEGISWEQGASYTVGITRNSASNPGENDDTWQTAPSLTVRGDRQKVDMDLVNDGYIGNGDNIDYRRVTFEKDGLYTIKLDDVHSSVKLTLYRVVDGGISEIASVTGDRKADGILRNLAIGAGEYVIAVEPGSLNASGTEYEVEIEGTVSSGSGNNSDDFWSSNVPTVTVSPDSWGNIDAELIENEWVGYDDLTDYRKLNITEAGVYNFTLGDLSSDAKLTLYSPNGGKLKKLKSVTGKAGKKGVIANLLLESGTYYLSVEASGRTKKSGTGYDVEVSGTAFTKGDNSDDSRETAPQIVVDGSGGWVERTLVDDGWVGYGDLIDYRELVLNTPGSYRFELEGLDNSAKLTVYAQKDGGIKKLKSVTGKDGKDGVTKELLLDSGTYYIAVEATGKTKKGGTDYEVEISGTTFTKGNPANNDFSTAEELSSDGTARGWVGFGDAVDYYRFTLTQGGFHDFALVAEKSKAALTISREEADGRMKAVKKIQAGKAIEDLELGKGTYYLQVQSGDKGKGKKNTDYEVLSDLTASELGFASSASGSGTAESWKSGLRTLA